MKKWILSLLISLLLFGYPNRVFAGNEFFCSTSYGSGCDFGGFVDGSNSCDPGYVLPCTTGDCCVEYYNQYGPPCPQTLICVLAPTATPTPRPGSSPTPSPRPTPTYAPGACAGPYGVYCDELRGTLSCQPDQYCDSSNAYGVPSGCSGRCVSLTPIPTVTPIGGGPTIPVYDPECTTDNGQEGVKSALGCLPTNPERFTNIALPWAIGIGAGIAFLLGVFGATMITLSAGNPEKMQAGKEMITSAIAGLLLIIFAMFILRVVGVDILKLFLFEEPGHPGGGGT